MSRTIKFDQKTSARLIIPGLILFAVVLLSLITFINIKWLPELWQELDEASANAERQDEQTNVEQSVEYGNSNYKVKIAIILLPFLEFLTILLVIVLGISIYLTYRQAKRNRIALAHLAHSIKTPVARLRLNTDTLLQGRVATVDEEIEGIEAINQECIRLEQAIRNSMFSLVKGRHILQLETCSLAEIVINTTLSWKLAFEKAGLELLIDNRGAELTGRFDSTMITIMMDNLIENALHYSRLRKSNLSHSYDGVTVSLGKQDNKGVIIVDDTGGGIPKSQSKKIFKQFYRRRDRDYTNTTGLGLGLSIVKKIVRAHGGSVRAEDNPSSPAQYPLKVDGARLIVELPITKGVNTILLSSDRRCERSEAISTNCH